MGEQADAQEEDGKASGSHGWNRKHTLAGRPYVWDISQLARKERIRCYDNLWCVSRCLSVSLIRYFVCVIVF